MGRAIGFASVTLQALHVTIEKQIERSLACAASHYYLQIESLRHHPFPKGAILRHRGSISRRRKSSKG